MFIDGVELFPISDISSLEDREPIFIEFDSGGIFKSQWGIVDKIRKVTIHKDFTLTFNNRCKYYSLHKEGKKADGKGVIVQF